MAKGVSSLARTASGLITGAAKAVRSGLNLAQKAARAVASAAARTVVNISSIAKRGYKAAKGFFSSFSSYVSYRTQQIKETIVRELCLNTGKVSTSQGKVNWNQASIKSISGNTGVLMPATASRIATAADAGALAETLANGWDDLLELLQAAGASLAGAIALPAAPGIGWAIPAVIVVVLFGPGMTVGETDEEIAEWKKQEEEEKNQKPATTDDEKIVILQTRKERL